MISRPSIRSLGAICLFLLSFLPVSLIGLQPRAVCQTIVPGQIVVSPTGGDVGAQINALQAQMPLNGGTILIPTLASGGCYSFTNPIVITKPIILQGQGPSTCLYFAAAGAAISFLQNGLSVVSNVIDGFGMRDFTLLGTGPSGGQTGLALGGTQNTAGFYAAGMNIESFGVGLQFNHGVWNFKIDHSLFGANYQNVVWPAETHFGGENMEFDHVTFIGANFTNSLIFNDSSGQNGFSNLNNLTFISCNFDDAQLFIGNGSGSVRLYSPHFENVQHTSSDGQPFVRISAYTAATDVEMNGPDFYNDANNPYPPDFVEINGGAVVLISQIRSVNFDATTNVPANILINGSPQVTLIGDAPLRATKQEYLITPGSNPRLTVVGGSEAANSVYCANGAGQDPCNAASSGNGVLTSLIPDGTPPISVISHTPPTNLNAWPATFNSNGQQIINPHITADKLILPASGMLTVQFAGSAQFTQTPACTVSYQTSYPIRSSRTLSSNPTATSITIFGAGYIGVYYQCVGN